MKTILIVDDEKDIRDVLAARLEFSGYECLKAKDGKEALRIAKHKSPALIILDLMMPTMDGFATYKALKSDRTTKHIPIIAYTAQDPGLVAQKGLEALDIVDFVLKPFDSQTVVKAVGKILKG